jgi:hypothetical protein
LALASIPLAGHTEEGDGNAKGVKGKKRREATFQIFCFAAFAFLSQIKGK